MEILTRVTVPSARSLRHFPGRSPGLRASLLTRRFHLPIHAMTNSGLQKTLNSPTVAGAASEFKVHVPQYQANSGTDFPFKPDA